MRKKQNLFTLAAALILSVSCLPVFAQQPAKLSGTFKLSGELSKYKDEAQKLMITWRKPAGGFVFDSVLVSNKRFDYSFELTEPMLALISIKSASSNTRGQAPRSNQPFDYLPIYAMPSVNVLTLKDSTLRTAVLSGGNAAINAEYDALYTKYEAFTSRGNDMIRGRGITDREKMTILRDSLTAAADEEFLKPYIMAHPASPVSLRVLMEYAARPYWRPRKNISPEMVMDLVKPMPAAFKQLPSINVLSKSLETAKKTLPGKPAMDFAALDTAGKEVRLSDFKGKTVFLDFWASWCVPCRKENPNVKKLYQQYKDKGLVVLSVSLDNPDKRGAWLKAISDDGIGGFVHISELKGFASQSALLYDVKAIPTNFIIDPQGKFLARNLYGEELNTKFSEIFSAKSK